MHTCVHRMCALFKKKVRETNGLMKQGGDRMDEDILIEKLSELVENLAFDYERLSQAGKDTYTEICSIVNLLQGG